MRLLIDSVPCVSPGIIAVRDELSRAVGRRAPEGCEAVVLATSDLAGELAGPLRVVRHPELAGRWLGRWRWYRRELPALAEQFAADVVYSMAGMLSKRLCARFATVTNMNNMLPFMPPGSATYPTFSYNGVRVRALRGVYVRSVRMADAVVLHSEHALDMVSGYAPEISPKTFVALTGIPENLGFARSAPPPHPYEGRPYLLYFSLFYAYRNHLRVLAAYRDCLAAEPDAPDLLLVGRPEEPGYVQQVIEEIGRLRLDGRARYVGPVDRESIAGWLHHALVNIFASTCETNPVTVAEVLGTGGVLACSSVPPMPEVAGAAADYFDPYSVPSIASTLLALIRRPERREELRRLAYERAGELSWDACADRVWQAAQAACAAHARRAA